MTTIWSEEKLEQWATAWSDKETREKVAASAEEKSYWEGKLVESRQELDGDPLDCILWYQCGVIFGFLDKPEEALDYFKGALRLAPNLDQAWWQVGSILYGMGKKEDAILAFEHKLNLAPEGYSKALSSFLSNKAEVVESLIKSTIAFINDSGYTIELFEDGTYQIIWDDMLGNKYESPGLLVPLPYFPAEVDIELEIDPVDPNNLIEEIQDSFSEILEYYLG